jgi:hypothetical protein
MMPTEISPIVSRVAMLKHLSFLAILTLLLATGVGRSAQAAVPGLSVRIDTGAVPLVAGSLVELRIYEVGGRVRHLPLAHGETWPADSTRVIAVRLSDALDPRTVMRYGIYYHAGNDNAPPWEIVSAEVDLESRGGAPERLLDAILSGVLDGHGELATAERSVGTLTCVTDADCDDHRSCNGIERCEPHAVGADARGCVKGKPVACPVNQICAEGRGCVGLDVAPSAAQRE